MAGRRFLFLLASGRPAGNSESLARSAPLPPGAEQSWLRLDGTPLPPFQDLRHAGGYGPPGEAAAGLAAQTLAASDLVFVAPLYWYGLPAAAKLYLDHWTHWLRVPELDFRARMAGKRLWLVMAHAGSTPAEIAPAVESLRLTAEYMAMRWGGALLGDANAPGEVATDATAREQARSFFLGD